MLTFLGYSVLAVTIVGALFLAFLSYMFRRVREAATIIQIAGPIRDGGTETVKYRGRAYRVTRAGTQVTVSRAGTRVTVSS